MLWSMGIPPGKAIKGQSLTIWFIALPTKSDNHCYKYSYPMTDQLRGSGHLKGPPRPEPTTLS